jgi:hypothetical protein
VLRPVSLLPVPCPARATLLEVPAYFSRSSVQGSPCSKAFALQTPPVGGRCYAVVHICSSASLLLYLRPTTQARARRDCGHWPSPTEPAVDYSRSHLGSPGFRAIGLCTCPGSLTPRVQYAARATATHCVAFPLGSRGRQPECGDFGAP